MNVNVHWRRKDHWGTLWAHGGGGGGLPKSFNFFFRAMRGMLVRRGRGRSVRRGEAEEGARSFSEKGGGANAFTIRFGA